MKAKEMPKFVSQIRARSHGAYAKDLIARLAAPKNPTPPRESPRISARPLSLIDHESESKSQKKKRSRNRRHNSKHKVECKFCHRHVGKNGIVPRSGGICHGCWSSSNTVHATDPRTSQAMPFMKEWRDMFAKMCEMPMALWYSEIYLRSPLWRHIRNTVLQRDEYLCRICAKPTVLVHHASYDVLVLRGDCNDMLFSLCKECHSGVHFNGGYAKLSLKESNKLLYSRIDRQHSGSRNCQI
jgi:hypothetical protein